MSSGRLIVVGTLGLTLAVTLTGWLFGPRLRREFGLSPSKVAEAVVPKPPPPAPSPAPVPLPLPLPRLTVTGTGDATVEVKRRGATSESGCAQQGTTEPLCPGQYDVRALSPSGDRVALAVVRLNRGEHKTLELPLQPAAKLELFVADSDRLPVDRVNVTAQQPRTGVLIKGRTDSDGTLSLGPLPAGDWWVWAHRETFGGTAAIASTRGTTRLQLGKLVTASGTVVPPAGGVTVELATPEHVLITQTLTDGGSFTVGPVPPGRFELRTRSEDFEPHAELATLPATGVVLRLGTGATLKGDLVGANGERLDSEVHLTGPLGETRTVTARGGAFEVRALTPGRWMLASGEGRLYADVDGGISRVQLTVPVFDGVISGSCGFDGGHRMPAAVTIHATSENPVRTASARCDGGAFVLSGLPRGFYELELDAVDGLERWSGHHGPASTGTRDLALNVPGVGYLTYRLVDETGSPLATHSSERWETRDLPLELQLPGRVGVSRTASLQRGRDTALGDIVLLAGAKLSGRLLDAASKDPIAGATVTVGGTGHLTGSDGTFTSSEATEGDVEVFITHPRYVPQQRLAVAPGELGSVELTPAARVVGSVITADGAPPAGVEVWALCEHRSVVVPVENGAFATHHLANGHWLFRLAGEAVSAYDAVELDLEGSGDRPVVFVERAAGVTFEVAVTDRTGAPAASDVLLVPRAVAALPNEEEARRLLAKPALVGEATRQPARYRFANVLPGAYTLVASAHARVWTLTLPLAVQPGMGPVRAAFEQVPYSP